MNRERYLKKIINILGYLKNQVDLLNSISYYDINITSEYFYCDFLNLIYGYELKNANSITKNIKAIDLIDDKNRISIQVTSDNSSEKIKNTIKKFEESKGYEKYDRLIILIITSKKEYRVNFSSNYFIFKKETDIWDSKDICKFLENKDIALLEKVCKFLTDEVVFEEKKEIREANEVETIIDLIECLSQTRAKSITRYEVIIDPEYKINQRFKEFSNNLKERYKTLYLIYNSALNTVCQTLGIDEGTIIISRLFLQDTSVKFLTEEKNDPLKALEKLVNYFEEKLVTHQKKYDQKAIEFFLIDQIIKCNVFPNLKEEYNAIGYR